MKNSRESLTEDGKVTQAEWVLHWSCAYGDTAAYARYTWQQIGRGAEYIQSSQFSGPPFGKCCFLEFNFSESENEVYISAQAWVSIVCTRLMMA